MNAAARILRDAGVEVTYQDERDGHGASGRRGTTRVLLVLAPREQPVLTWWRETDPFPCVGHWDVGRSSYRDLEAPLDAVPAILADLLGGSA